MVTCLSFFYLLSSSLRTMNQDDYTRSTTSQLMTWSDLPPGYTVVIGPDGRRYLIPTLMLSVAEVGLEGEKHKKSMAVDEATGGVGKLVLESIFEIDFTSQPLPARLIPYADIEAGHVQIPVDPVSAPHNHAGHV